MRRQALPPGPDRHLPFDLSYKALLLAGSGLALLLVCTIYSVKTFLGDWLDFFREIGFALIIAALLIWATEAATRRELTRLFDESIDRIEKGLEQGVQMILATSKLAALPSHIGASDVPMIQRMGGEVYDFYIDGLKPFANGFMLNDTDWALQSASILYRCLGHMLDGIEEVRVTHTGTIDIWCNENVASVALQGQQALIEKGTTITRIFVGPEPVPLSETSKYNQAINIMRRHGIKAGYVYEPNPSSVLDMTWIPAVDAVMVWEPRPMGGVAKVVVTSPAKREENLDDLWRVLLNATLQDGRGVPVG